MGGGVSFMFVAARREWLPWGAMGEPPVRPSCGRWILVAGFRADALCGYCFLIGGHRGAAMA